MVMFLIPANHFKLPPRSENFLGLDVFFRKPLLFVTMFLILSGIYASNNFSDMPTMTVVNEGAQIVRENLDLCK